MTNVTDFALVRFLERAGGLDVAGLRLKIAASLYRAASAAELIGQQRYTVHADGLIYVVVDGALINVLHGDAPAYARAVNLQR